MDRIVKKGIIGVVLFLVLMVSGVTGLRTYAYEVGEVIPKSDYLTFTAEEDNSSVTIRYYSTDSLKYNKGSGWADYTNGTEIELNKGEKVSFYGTDVRVSSSRHVNITGKVAASGDVCSLRLDSDGKFAGLSDSCFQYMFYNCKGLTKAPELSATTLTRLCYFRMFCDCESLTKAPKLPATDLTQYCYSYMFSNCTSLTEPPALPATTLADSCYYDMFSGCTRLREAPALPATTLADDCYYEMFYGCMSLTELPALPATTLAISCYDSMFFNCKSIKLSADQGAYYNAKYKIPSSGEGTTAVGALTNMFSVTGGTFTGTPDINKVYYIHKKAAAAPAFTVTIPAEVALSAASSTSAEISASEVHIPDDKMVVVTLESASNTANGSGAFTLKNSAGNSSAKYTIGKGNETTGVKVGDEVAEFIDDGTTKLTFSAVNAANLACAGDHTEILTFNVAVQEAPLTFKVGDMELKYGRLDTTWDDIIKRNPDKLVRDMNSSHYISHGLWYMVKDKTENNYVYCLKGSTKEFVNVEDAFDPLVTYMWGN